MGDNEVRELKDYVGKVKEELLGAIGNLRVHLAEDYVPKSDMKWIIGIAATIGGSIVATVMGILTLFLRAKGGQ